MGTRRTVGSSRYPMATHRSLATPARRSATSSLRCVAVALRKPTTASPSSADRLSASVDYRPPVGSTPHSTLRVLSLGSAPVVRASGPFDTLRCFDLFPPPPARDVLRLMNRVAVP